MTATPRIALIGDYNPDYKAHAGIPRALKIANERRACSWEWVHSSALGHDASHQLARYQGIWCVPGSPYANTRGVLDAIRFARTTNRPFLGTCGGFQHACME